MWELRERGEVLSVQTRAKPAEAARAGFAEGATAAELAVPDLSVRITIMLPNPTFRLIENPVVPRDSVIYT